MLDRAANQSSLVRSTFLLIGWLAVALGVIGAFVPIMPSTMFFLVALWAFSKGSERFHTWLYHHPRFGPSIQAWHEHRAIPVAAKLVAHASMIGGILVVAVSGAGGTLVLVGYGAGCAIVSAYIMSRPSRGPVPVAAHVSTADTFETVPLDAR